MTDLLVTRYFEHCRVISLGGKVIVEGVVRHDHAGPSPELAAELGTWRGHHYWDDTPEGRWLVLIAEGSPRAERWWLHVALFVGALVTTSMAGAGFISRNELSHWPGLDSIISGLPFALPLTAIMIAHESGHYFLARRYRVDASPPYFLPFPARFSLLGTMGAFIRLRSPIFDRRTLFDIAVAGPLAGMLVALPLLVSGVLLSDPVSAAPRFALAHQLVLVEGFAVYLGDSILFAAIRDAVGIEGTILLHPAAIAGWAGLLITALNLLPLAQLDGGHIAFALFGPRQAWVARSAWLLLVLLGWWFWHGWWIWAALALLVGRGRLSHPKVISPGRGLGRGRRALASFALLMLVLVFSPLPLAIP